jgi:glycosyltransferase involved in cell wall biosynthesis
VAYETDEWFAALDRLLADPELRQTIGEAANTEAKKKFDIVKNAKMWDKAYKAILKRHKAGVNAL